MQISIKTIVYDVKNQLQSMALILMSMIDSAIDWIDQTTMMTFDNWETFRLFAIKEV